MMAALGRGIKGDGVEEGGRIRTQSRMRSRSPGTGWPVQARWLSWRSPRSRRAMVSDGKVHSLSHGERTRILEDYFVFKCHEPRTDKRECVLRRPRECEMNQPVATIGAGLLAASSYGAKATYTVLRARRGLSILVDVPRHTSWGSTFKFHGQGHILQAQIDVWGSSAQAHLSSYPLQHLGSFDLETRYI